LIELATVPVTVRVPVLVSAEATAANITMPAAIANFFIVISLFR
jgi:hypothetical protein